MNKKALTLFGYEIPISTVLTAGTIIVSAVLAYSALQQSVAVMHQEVITVVEKLDEHRKLDMHIPGNIRVSQLEVLVKGMSEDLKEIRKVLVERGYK